MELFNECFDKVKNDYLKFLDKEEIIIKSRVNKIKSLKNFYIPMSFWIENKYKKKRRNFIYWFFWRTGLRKNNNC